MFYDRINAAFPQNRPKLFQTALARCRMNRLNLYLIKPSQYDDDGYVVRHWRGVLPSNTLACLAGLTEDVIKQNRLGDRWNVKVHLYDETVDKIPVGKICRSERWGLAKTIVGLVGVQTNQFPRACDLAKEFRRAGLTGR